MSADKLRYLLTGLFIGVVVYAIFVLAMGYDEVTAGLAMLKMSDWGLLLALSTVHFLLRFVRWQRYLDVLGHKVSSVSSLLYYLTGFALTTTPGKVGENWRAVYLKKHAVPYADTFAGFFAERYTDLVSIVMLSALAIGIYEGASWPIAAVCLVLLGILAVLQTPSLPRRLRSWSRRHVARRFATSLRSLARVLDGSAQLLRPALIAFAVSIALAAWALQGLVLYAVLVMMGAEVSVAVSIGIYSLGILAGAISFLPGGLGSAEAVMVLLLIVAGLDAPDAAVATMLCRIATLWYAVILGLGAVFAVGLRGHLTRGAA